MILELNSFGADSAQECVKYLDEYADLDKIIIDIRNNSGGYQTSVKEICGLFIGPDKIYLKEKGLDGVEMADYTTAIKTYDNFRNIIILTNENTASAAEVFAICMREQCEGVMIVGTTTFGKGVIQTSRYLSNGGALKVTSYYWYSPNGVSIHKTGVIPDVEVRMDDICYEYFYSMADDETYEIDSVSEANRIAQLSLQYLDYEPSRTDGYFDEGTQAALLRFKEEHNLGSAAVLDRGTMEALISDVSRAISLDPLKDKQMMKAKELIHGNQH